MALLEVSGLTVAYGQRRVVHGISLAVTAGEVVVVLGPNGAGKTSLLNAISGVVAAGGTVTFGGRDVSRMSPHTLARLGMVQVPEGRRIFSPLTVADNLLVGAYIIRDRHEIQRRQAEIYEMFPVLFNRRSALGGLLSGGEQQLLAFGRALMSRPKVMLLDEPTMGLSPLMVERIMDAVATMRSAGYTVVMVEQNAAAAIEIADNCSVIDQGRIVLSGSPAEVRDHPGVLAAYLGVEEDYVA